MAAKCACPDEADNKHDRFLDADQEPRRMLQPIEGYQKLALLTLEKSVESIVFCCPDIVRRAFIAMSNCENPADGLDQNESAAIFLYTMEWEPIEECLYYALNKTLRTENRQRLKSWYSYWKLILSALQKLPSQKPTIWRGVTLDLSQQYEIGKRYIRSHSYIDVEDEILLLPATQFEVISKLKLSIDLQIIHLKQVDPPFPLIELPIKNMTMSQTSHCKKDEGQPSCTYQNDKLEKLICSMIKDVDLEGQGLIDNDIPIVIKLAINDRKCLYLNLNTNKITDEGAQYLAEMLASNPSLSILQITGNQITDAGVHWIAQALRNNTKLTYLSLTNNKMTHKGVQSLAKALQANSPLHSLYIGGNPIGDTGAQYIAEVLSQTTVIKALQIGPCQIADNGMICLAEMLRRNDTLTTLYLDNNLLTDNGVKVIMDALCNNRRLKHNETLIELRVLQKSFTNQEQDQLRTMAITVTNRQIHFRAD
ncbi:unnamed protein product [Rotaria magnacalcarata]|uniref:Uncharacterized protein n=2 Tax=Rotaria magnacalcarata TaxID=392030 RepID=A0A819W9Q9_9BILA|nr:unnamed protein product [Rotaria magnacalcarata]CAF4119808.1 unnamed protein product [Rotaria magnacalcarata]